MVELNQSKMLEESMWPQKSKVSGLRDGYYNTLHFQKIALNRRWVNIITPPMAGLSENALVSEVMLVVSKAFLGRFKSNKWIHVES